MESTCAEDQQQAAVAYCACEFPLVPLCQKHADKHLADSHGFHFALPLSAIQIISSEEVHMKAKYWLFQLNDNCGLLRKKLQLLASGEDQIEAAYQDLLRFGSEAKTRLKQEFSEKKEAFRAEIEKAITETRNHALETYEPGSVLAKLLWHTEPHQLVSYQLFNLQAKFNQERFSSTFQIALNFVSGLEDLNIGKWGASLPDQMEELTKQLASQQENHLAQVQILSQQLEEAKAHETRSQVEQQMSLKLQETERQLQTLQMKYQLIDTSNNSLLTENEILKKQCQIQAARLTDYQQSLQRSAQLEGKLKELNAAVEETMQKYQALRIDCAAKDERYVLLLQQNNELQKEGKLQQNKLKKLTIKRKRTNKKYCDLGEWLRKTRGIAIDPPTESEEPVPDYTTPESRAAREKFGPYSEKDDQLVLFRRGPVRNSVGVYIGQWNNRKKKHGYGRFLWKDGSIYEGQWRNGMRTGRGRYIWPDGDVEIGDFLKDKFTGFGTIYYPDGRQDSGMWRNGKMNGLGSCEFPTGDRYVGEFLNDYFTGTGAYLWSDGSMYVGSWKAHKEHGKGLMKYSCGNIYYGDFKNGLRSGTGFCVSPNGDVYQGQWERGRHSGQGRLTHPGTVEEGVWEDDVLLAK